MRPAPARGVLFDLDGTLVDTAPDLAGAVHRLLGELGREPVATERIAAVVSKGGRAMLEVALPDLDVEARERLLPRFLGLYGERIAERSTLYAGVADVLDQLEAGGMAWAVVTNKPEGLARDLMQRIGLLPRCPVLVGGDTLPQRKPSPEPLWHACAALGIAPADCVYVGDDERDALAAQAAGMPAVVALWGYRQAHEDPFAWPSAAQCRLPLDLLDLPWFGAGRGA